MKKLVTESIHDFLKFKEGGDPISDMNIGIKKMVISWLDKYDIPRHLYDLSEDYKITVYTTVILSGILTEDELPEYIQFKDIHGGFHCNNNNLISLRGMPESISGSFICKNNKISSLLYGPKYVNGDYSMTVNNLESLEGISTIINGSLWLGKNKLKSLQYCPSEIKGNLDITYNPIETLDHFPDKIHGDLYFSISDILTEKLVRNKFRDRVKGKIKGFIN
jgi:hypothetical protein